MISYREREKIRLQAKVILNNFAKALDKVKVSGEKIKKPQEGYRNEGSGEKVDSSFREIMFANAPEKKGDYIIAEKKKWR